MTPLDKLIAYFEKFPGIGARQAKRFAFHILTLRKEQVEELSELIVSLPQSVSECIECHRFFSGRATQGGLCSICSDLTRDHGKLLVVARDTDIQAIERSGIYDGLYFVLGGTISLLNPPEANAKLRTGAFRGMVEKRLSENLSEIILAFAVNPDGENTTRYIQGVLRDISGAEKLKVSELGRGLSTGSELEYADPETIKSALNNRS